ncbi:MAG: tRNA 2-thiocytidine(32) synthetase TtcA [Bdellovibrionaceae bacterium]|nr:tRNA 2-thiocytidine(32) synthetase TtcA [Pseudobdellovibrionaceae bacterium]
MEIQTQTLPSFDSPLATKVRKQIVQALNDFNMIEDGDKIAVAVSGGKDSSILVVLLNEIRKRSERKFTIEAMLLDQKQPGFDAGSFKQWIESLGIKLHILEKDTYSIVKEKTPEGSVYCTLCAKFRRAILYDFAHENGFTKMALGHHRDDLIETTLLNLFYIGQLASMPAKLKSDDGRNLVIRPLVYVAEKDLKHLAADWGFPIIPCNLCGSQETLKRKKMKKLVSDLEMEIPNIGASILSALGSTQPSHLLDHKLWDFKNLK